MNKKVLILGCGPAGLMAAHAAAMAGADIKIVSKRRKSHLFGCQYLHQPIPLITNDEPVDVNYTLQGSIKGYREKVYGTQLVKASPESLETNHKAWDIRQTYDALWEMYGDYVIDYDIPRGLGDVLYQVAEADIAISTIPAPLLCTEEHNFQAELIYALGDAPEVGQTVPFTCPENTVVCNGNDAPSWYRMSRVFGYTTVEWPGAKKPPINGVSPVQKPLKHNCTCHPEIKRMGRYGKWEKGVLSHEAYFETQDLLNDWTLF